MGILEKPFEICLVLAIMLLFVNAFLFSFGSTMTGEDEEIFSSFKVDVNSSRPVESGSTTPLNLWEVPVSVIKQVTDPLVSAIVNVTGWNNFQIILSGLVVGWQVIVDKIFVGELVIFGSLIKTILLIIEAVGVAYLPFAILSAWKGGGSP